jgi:hypothetical protein
VSRRPSDDAENAMVSADLDGIEPADAPVIVHQLASFVAGYSR